MLPLLCVLPRRLMDGVRRKLQRVSLSSAMLLGSQLEVPIPLTLQGILGVSFSSSRFRLIPALISLCLGTSVPH